VERAAVAPGERRAARAVARLVGDEHEGDESGHESWDAERDDPEDRAIVQVEESRGVLREPHRGLPACARKPAVDCSIHLRAKEIHADDERVKQGGNGDPLHFLSSLFYSDSSNLGESGAYGLIT
jgi:hypothetical protein